MSEKDERHGRGGVGGIQKRRPREGLERGFPKGDGRFAGGEDPKMKLRKLPPVDQKMTNSTPMLCNSSYDCTAPCWDD